MKFVECVNCMCLLLHDSMSILCGVGFQFVFVLPV